MQNLQTGKNSSSGSNKARAMLLSVTALTNLSLMQPVQAAEIWVGPTASSVNFNDTSQWVGGVVPGAGDQVVLASTTTHTVTFGNSVSNQFLATNSGRFTFDLNGNDYSLTGGSALLPGLSVVQKTLFSTSSTELTLVNGTVTTDFTRIGGAAPVFGASTLTVDSGATLDNSGDIYVGGDNTGAGGALGNLNVSSGGTANTSVLQVFGNSTVNNSGGVLNSDTVTIEGGGDVSSSSTITVGTTGTGAGVNIADSAFVTGSGSTLTATSANLILGQGGATGQLEVGGGANISSETMYVGLVGTGTLAITSGASALTDSNSYIGLFDGSFGIVTVDGSESEWSNGGSLYVGGSTDGSGGRGVLNVSSGGTVNALGLRVWDNGSVNNIDGTINSDTLAVEGGGAVSSFGAGGITVGTTNSPTGINIASFALVTGSDSTMAVSSESLVVGQNTTGVLRVEAGASISSDELFVGSLGTGTLDINSGGSASNNTGYIALLSNSSGTVTVDGSGSKWVNGGSLYVGGAPSGSGGTGSLTVSNDGLVEATGNLKVWGTGAVNLDGGTISAGDFDSSRGTFNFDNGTVNINGGRFNDGATDLTLDGAGSGDTATLNLIGGSASYDNASIGLINDGGVAVSNNGFQHGLLDLTGALTVYEHGTVTGSGGTINADTLTVEGGGDVLSSNTISVGTSGTGDGINIANTVNLVEGIVAATDIDIFAGGTVTSSHIVRIGADISLDGVNVSNSVDVAGNGALLDATGNTISVGRRADGTLNIKEGGRVVALRGRVGDESLGFTGTINIDGDGSELDITNTLYLGYDVDSTGILNMTDSARLEATSLAIGGRSGSSRGAGTANIGINSIVDIAETTVVYDEGTVNFTDGTFVTNDLSIKAGGTFNSDGADALLKVTDALQVSGGGTVNLAGGSVTAASVDNEGTVAVTADSSLASTISNTNTGRVEVSNNATLTLAGDVTHNGEAIHVDTGSTVIFEGAVDGASDYTGTGNHIFEGSFGPGNSPGLVNIAGDVTFDGSNTLIMELAGLTAGSEYDVVAIAGTATLGGLLNVDLLSGFLPSEGDSFDLLTAATLVGTFNFDTTLGEGLVWDLQYLLDDPSGQDILRLSAVSAVPIPEAVWLFGSALLGLVAIGRRRPSLQYLST